MAGRNEVDIKASITGAESVKRGFRGIGNEARKVGNATARSGKKSSAVLVDTNKRLERQHSLFSRLKKSVMGWGAGLLGFVTAISIATKAITEHFRHISEAAEKATSAIQAQRDLIFLGEFRKRHPQLQQEIQSLAEHGRLGVGGQKQAAKAYEMAVSKMPFASDRERIDILKEVFEYKRTAGEDVTTKNLIDLFVFLKQTRPDVTANQLQNLVQEAVTLGGAETTAYSQHMPKLLGTGKLGGLTLPQTVGLFAKGTGVDPDPSSVATALNRIIMIMRGGGPESEKAQKMMRRLKISSSAPFMEQYRRMYEAHRSGQLGLPEVKEVFGLYGGPLMGKMIPVYPEVVKTQERLGEVFGQPDLDLTADMLEWTRANDEYFRLEEDIRLLESQKQHVIFNKDAIRALKLKRFKLAMYINLRKDDEFGEGSGHLRASWEAWRSEKLENVFADTENIDVRMPALTPMPIIDSHDTVIITNINQGGQPEQQGQAPAAPDNF